MQQKLLISASVVIGIAAISIVFFVKSFDINMPVQKTLNVMEEPKVTMLPISADILTTIALEPIEQIDDNEDNERMKDRYLLAKIAMAEAESEDTEGKALVMLVVLNRVWDDEEFPDTIKEVIYQPGQFSPISNGRFDKVEPDADCWAALDLITVGKWDESYGATYFESKSESTWHSENLDFLFQHGKHYFYKDRGKQ